MTTPLGTHPSPADTTVSQEAIVICTSDSLRWSTLTATFRKEKKKRSVGERDETQAFNILVGTEKQKPPLFQPSAQRSQDSIAKCLSGTAQFVWKVDIRPGGSE